MPEEQRKKPFYREMWFAVLMLFFPFPPFGLVLIVLNAESKKKGFIYLGVMLCVVFAIVAFSKKQVKVENASKLDSVKQEIKVVLDSPKYYRISSSELVDLLGEPQKTEGINLKFRNTGEDVVGQIYMYEKFNGNDHLEFVVADDKVVRASIYSNKFYYDTKGENIPFTSKEELFKMFNIDITNETRKTVDNNFTLRYSPVSDTVADFWVTGIENGNNFGVAKITYDLRYF